MDKDKSAIEQFLGDTEPKDSVFSEQEIPAETPAESEEPKEEKPLPFHKDPKIQRYLEKREREMEERIRSSIPTHEDKNEEKFKEVMDSLTTIIGNNTPEKVSALNAFHKALNTLDERAIQTAREEIREIQAREEQEDSLAQEELDNSLEAIEESYDVDITSPQAQKLRSEFLTYVEKIAPKDRNGEIAEYPDMFAAWETFNDIKKATQTPSRAKELANRGLSRSTETTTKPQQRISWNTVEEMMDNLK